MVEVKLKVQAGSNAGKEIPVPMSRFLIGRSDECQLRPKSDAISRNHCVILVHEEDVTIRDLNSRNGTYVNDEKISGDHQLKNGDMLRVGKLEFEVLMKIDRKQVAVPDADTGAGRKPDDASDEFDVAEWLEEANATDKQRRSDPDTRQFKLDETDRIALNASAEAAAMADSDSAVKKAPVKGPPGKLPERHKQAAANSREAAADMLKKFFNNK